jgi:uncharacterized protein with NRDE domain
MCIAAFAFGSSPDHALVFAANRDELHERPTAGADWWGDHPNVLGGRDLSAGGSWLAVDRRGRLAAVTNLPQAVKREFPRSRGGLVLGFVDGDASAARFATDFTAERDAYGPCNLLLWDGREFWYAATGIAPVRLPAGVHAVSNALYGADWPRVHRATEGLRSALGDADLPSALLTMLGNGEAGSTVEDRAERHRTEIFIRDPRYGTRSSTVVVIGNDGRVQFAERSFEADAVPIGERRYEFEIAP